MSWSYFFSKYCCVLIADLKALKFVGRIVGSTGRSQKSTTGKRLIDILLFDILRIHEMSSLLEFSLIRRETFYGQLVMMIYLSLSGALKELVLIMCFL